jgi:hypothetical protein
MSKQNPAKAMAAILPLPIQAGKDIVVQPMTLGMYAALERIGSPLVTGEDPKDLLELIPSLYLVTHDPREVFRGNLVELAMEWAIAVPASVVEAIRTAASRQLNAALDVIPEDSDDPLKKKREMTDGLRISSTGRLTRSAGATRKSCGKSRSRRSAS